MAWLYSYRATRIIAWRQKIDTPPLDSKRARNFCDRLYNGMADGQSPGGEVTSLIARNNMARSGPLFLRGMPSSMRFLETMGIQAWTVLKYILAISTTLFSCVSMPRTSWCLVRTGY
jgi:hypothetical protein